LNLKEQDFLGEFADKKKERSLS